MSNWPNEDDKNLVVKLSHGEVKAFDALFYKYSRRLYAFSFSLLKNEEDSKEIVQEAFLKIWNKRLEIDSSKSFKSYLFAVSYNLIVDHLRHKIKNQEYQKFLLDYFNEDNTQVNNYAEYEILSGEIEQAVEELPTKRKQIFKLSRESGLSYNAIALKLGISEKTVENQITLSLRHIKQRF